MGGGDTDSVSSNEDDGVIVSPVLKEKGKKGESSDASGDTNQHLTGPTKQESWSSVGSFTALGGRSQSGMAMAVPLDKSGSAATGAVGRTGYIDVGDISGGASSTTVFYEQANVCVHPRPEKQNEFISGVLMLTLTDTPDEPALLTWVPVGATGMTGSGGSSVGIGTAAGGIGIDTTSEGKKEMQDKSELNPEAEKLRMYAIKVAVSSIKSIRKNARTIGMSRVIIVTKGGVAFPPFYFHDGGIKELFACLRTIVNLKKSSEDPNLFLVDDDKELLQHSLASLDMGGFFPDWTDISVNAVKEVGTWAVKEMPWSILDRFSRVTKFAREASSKVGDVIKTAKDGFESVIQDGQSSKPEKSDGEAPALIKAMNTAKEDLVNNNRTQNPGDDENDDDTALNSAIGLALTPTVVKKEIGEGKEEEGEKGEESQVGSFELIDTKDKVNVLVPVLDRYPELQSPVSRLEYEEKYYNIATGKIFEEKIVELRGKIANGGIEPELRRELWPVILGVYSWRSSAVEKAMKRVELSEQYNVLKHQWQSVTTEQETHFCKYRERRARIEKDVVRTDRELEFFAGDENKNVTMLRDILMSYSFFNFDLGYVQGMSDLLSPIVYVMQDEVDAFWCFSSLMSRLEVNFQRDQNGMHKQLSMLASLIKYGDPELYDYLEQRNSLNLFFCFRWVLIQFKREFVFDDTMRLWEVAWAQPNTEYFHLFVALAVLLEQSPRILEEKMEFDDILKSVNDLSHRIDLSGVIRHGLALFDMMKEIFATDPVLEDIWKEAE